MAIPGMQELFVSLLKGLADGESRSMVELMTDYDVGVSTEWTYAVKRVDSDYFLEE